MRQSLDQALDDAVSVYATKRPKTAAFHQRARAVMPGGNTRTILYTDPFPIRIEHAEGSTLTDLDGHTYADYVGEYSAGIYGHSNHKITAAIHTAMSRGINMGAHHTAEVPFAEAVTQRFKIDRVRFTNSGTEANMLALAAARNHTGKSAIMPMRGGYHGGTLYFGIHGDSPTNVPFDYILGRYNETEFTEALIEKHAESLAAIIIEPMMGSGGCISATREFLLMLRAASDRHGILLIFDEVMTSRLAPHGLSVAWNITPDLKTLGKYIGGGMSIGAFGGRAEIMDQFDPARQNALPHAGTFNNNTLSMTAGLAGLTEVYTPEASVQLNASGERLKARLNDMFMKHQARLQVTGLGSLMSLHPVAGDLDRPEKLLEADNRLRRLIYFHLLEDGLYLAERGMMALSLALNENDHDRLVNSLQTFVEKHRALI
jgi:glutamate-1-semialdehyde 2,1-aminomutase